jgi:hypothetical protein
MLSADRVLVVGQACDAEPGDSMESSPTCRPGLPTVVTLDLKTSKWRVVPVPAALRSFTADAHKSIHAVGSTRNGRVVIRFSDLLRSQFWTVDAQSGSWAHLGDIDTELNGVCVNGDLLVALTTRYKNGDRILDHNPVRLGLSGIGFKDDGAVDPTISLLDVNRPHGWSRSAPARTPPIPDGLGPKLTCTGGYAVATAAGGPARFFAAFDLANRTWRPTHPPEPTNFFIDQVGTDAVSAFVPTNDPLSVRRPSGYAYDPARDRWQELADMPMSVGPDAVTSAGHAIGYIAVPPSGPGSPPPQERRVLYYELP